ncbi:MAG: MoaD/ThiS family protein [Thermoplasmatota archaeon]
MNVTVIFFAAHRKAVGEHRIDMDVETGATVEDLLDMLVRRYPGLRELRPTTIVSCNHRVADGNEKLEDGDEVALLSPVGGG